MRRRAFLGGLGTSLAVPTPLLGIQPGHAPRAPPGETVERQKGDPQAPYEYVTFDAEKLKAMTQVSDASKAAFQAWDQDLPSKMLAVASQFVGISRETAPEKITKFLELFHLPFKDDNGYVAFCAAGVSFCALAAFVTSSFGDGGSDLEQCRALMPDLDYYYFYPTVSCLDMYHIAAGRHRWIEHTPKAKSVPKPGWVVLFDWSKSGVPDHCGLVTKADDKIIKTIEFNTSGPAGGSQRDGGTVATKDRNYSYVRGFIATDSRPKPPK
jgi:hypothetical protein